MPLPIIPGTDASGVVEAVAADIRGLEVGDEVFGMLRFPSAESAAYAEYVAAPAPDLARKPAGIDHVHAAGAPMAGLTAWQFLIVRAPGHREHRFRRIVNTHSTIVNTPASAPSARSAKGDDAT